MLEQVRVLENPLFIGIQMALYTSQDFLIRARIKAGYDAECSAILKL